MVIKQSALRKPKLIVQFGICVCFIRSVQQSSVKEMFDFTHYRVALNWILKTSNRDEITCSTIYFKMFSLLRFTVHLYSTVKPVYSGHLGTSLKCPD